MDNTEYADFVAGIFTLEQKEGNRTNVYLLKHFISNLPGNWKTSLCDFYRMCLLSVSVSYKLVSCCLIVIKRSIRVKLLPLAVPDLGPIYHFADDCFNVGHFPVSFPDAKASKGQSGLPCMLVKYYCISPGGESVLSFVPDG